MAAACGAKTRKGGRCKQSGVGAGGRCKFHGGKSLVGPAAPAWRHGRHSKYLPRDLASRYQEALRDPDLIGLRDELALVDVRMAQLLEALGQSGNTTLWKQARAKLEAFKVAGAKGRAGVEEARTTLQDLDALIASGLTAATTWDELRDTIDLRRRLSESETKRLRDLHQMISAERALALMAMLLDVVKQHVTDRHILAAIADQYARLTGQRGGATLTP
jgi:hypothetical protein